MAETGLDTRNPNAITYETQEICYTILGGIRLEGLDRLRVTVKIEVVNRKMQHYLNNPDIAGLAIRQNLDLYSLTQTEKLGRLVADRLEVGLTAVMKDLSDITAELERYRLRELETRREEETRRVKPLSEEERAEAIKFLERKDLMDATNEMIGRSGIEGEELNRLIMWLVFTSRKTMRPLHVISMGSSGTGKSHLQEKVGELIPEEDRIEITALTENAFYYFDKAALGHKLILIEDLDGVWKALYPLRELQSRQRISKTITVKEQNGTTRAIHLKVNGPVCIAGCTTKESIYEDNANRCFLLYLDESAEQDARVMAYQRRLSAGKVNTSEELAARRLLQNVQSVLEPVSVINPYAELLDIPAEVFKKRRTNAHYLSFIEVITFYKQCQREKKVDVLTGEVYIETGPEDIAEANALLKQILLRKSDALSGAARNYFEDLKIYLAQTNESSFTNASARSGLRVALSTVKRYHAALADAGMIRKIERRNDKAHHYEIVSPEEYQRLQTCIGTALDEALHKITNDGSQGSPAAQNKNEPIKAKRMKALTQPPAALQE